MALVRRESSDSNTSTITSLGIVGKVLLVPLYVACAIPIGGMWALIFVGMDNDHAGAACWCAISIYPEDAREGAVGDTIGSPKETRCTLMVVMLVFGVRCRRVAS
jgi:hypothetical protein